MNTLEPDSLNAAAEIDVRPGARRIHHRRWLLLPLIILLSISSGGAWLWAQGRQGSPIPGPQPAFGQLQTSPANFVLNTPTVVSFTITIDVPTLNPTTVELQRVDPAGNLLNTVGRMFDNGQGGDPKPGDRIFTARVTLNEPQVGRLYFRVAAAFRGNQQNAQSVPIFVDVDPFPLPPDPGAPGKATLDGIDSNKNGVRDDLERWIALKYAGTPSLIPHLNQYANVQSSLVWDAHDDETVLRLADSRRRLAACWNFLMPNDHRRTLKELEALTVNTSARLDSYANADRKLSGRTFLLVKVSAEACNP